MKKKKKNAPNTFEEWKKVVKIQFIEKHKSKHVKSFLSSFLKLIHNKSQGHKTATETLYITVQNDKSSKDMGHTWVFKQIISPYTTTKTPYYVYKPTVRLPHSFGSIIYSNFLNFLKTYRTIYI